MLEKEVIMKKLVVIGLVGTIIGSGSSFIASARQTDQFAYFKVTYSGGEKYTNKWLKKETTGLNGAVNLADDTGTAWVTATMRNSNDESRGSVILQRGTRKEFETPHAKADYNYILGVKKTYNTGGGSVKINGSWSPDCK